MNRRHALLGLLAAVASAPGRAAWSQIPASASAPSTGAAIPDEPPTALEVARSKFEHLLAPVHINGQGPFNFILDTGANVSCVSGALAERLALVQGAPAQVHTMVGVRTRPSVIIDQLAIGDRNRTGVRAPSLPALGSKIDGILGVDWLNGQRLVLDFKKRSIEITASKRESSAENRVIVPARRRFGQLTIVDADLSGRRISAMIDSGSQATLCNRPLHDLVLKMEAHKRFKTERQKVGLETLIGEPFSGELFYLPFLRLGGLQLGNVPVYYADTHVFEVWGLKNEPAIVLGMDLLTQFNAVALDFGRSQVRFDLG